ncbi:MAG: RHS repeat-associated core domain-containing protein [Clostridia bacterium]|nr:RHS repeat-associated core domain-containing protein [Clostridia bacterium]
MGADMTWFGRQMMSYSKNGTSISYTYDADGLRTGKTVNGVKHNYYYVDGQLRYERNGDNYEIYYTYNADGRPVLATKRDLVAKKNYQYYLITNTRGDIIETRDDYGNVSAKFVYDAWGKLVAVTDANGNALATDSFAYQISLKYRGYVYDNETGLYYLQSRYYDPESGRFLNADDVEYILIMAFIRNMPNLYSYCWNNPVLYEDVTGNLVWPGEIHNQVIGRIVDKNSGLSTQIKINYKDGGYGYCDIIHFSRKQIWEVKRNTVSFVKAYNQLTKYVNGYYQQKNPPKTIDGFNYGTNTLGDGEIDDYKNYYIWYWYEGSGIIYYNYYELSTQKSYYTVTSPSTVPISMVLTTLIFMLGVLSMFGGRSKVDAIV